MDFFSVVFLVVVFAAISLGSFGGKKQVPVPNSCLSLAPGEEKQRENATLHMRSECILNELTSLLTVPLLSKWETTVKQKSRNPNVLSKIFMSQLAHCGSCRSDVTGCDTLCAKAVHHASVEVFVHPAARIRQLGVINPPRHGVGIRSASQVAGFWKKSRLVQLTEKKTNLRGRGNNPFPVTWGFSRNRAWNPGRGLGT